MAVPVGLISQVILQTIIQGSKIVDKINAGEMTDEEAEAAWDATVAPGWLNAFSTWKDTKAPDET